MKQLILIFLSTSVLFACGTKEKPSEDKIQVSNLPREKMDSSPGARNQAEEQIDIENLQIVLNLESSSELGYRERKFNTCEVNSGYASSANCRQRVFILLQFQLLCRESEGTVSEVIMPNDLRPIANQRVRWSMKGLFGEAYTDERGVGKIMTVSKESQKLQRLRLGLGEDFLAVRAGEIHQLITPGNWCR